MEEQIGNELIQDWGFFRRGLREWLLLNWYRKGSGKRHTIMSLVLSDQWDDLSLRLGSCCISHLVLLRARHSDKPKKWLHSRLGKQGWIMYPVAIKKFPLQNTTSLPLKKLALAFKPVWGVMSTTLEGFQLQLSLGLGAAESR